MKHFYRAKLALIDAVYAVTMDLMDLLETARKQTHRKWWALAKAGGDI